MKKAMLIASLIISSVLCFYWIVLYSDSNAEVEAPVTMEKSPVNDSLLSDELSMAIPEKIESPYPDTITLTITNHTDKLFQYGRAWTLEKRIDEEWYVVPRKEGYAFTTELIMMKADQIEVVIYLNSFAGLTAGTYRMIKNFTEYKIVEEQTLRSAEYIISSNEFLLK